MIGTGRRRRPAIDLDHSINAAKEAAKQAGKDLSKARMVQRNERRKKARLVKKAGQLSSADLDRISVLKRSGFWDPALENPRPMPEASSGSGSSSAAAASVCSAPTDADDDHSSAAGSEAGRLAEVSVATSLAENLANRAEIEE